MTQTETSADQARAQFESIAAMVERLTHAAECTDPEGCGFHILNDDGEIETPEDREDYHDADEAQPRIHEDALSVQVRTDWHTPSTERTDPAEFEILLCTGGPAVRLVGDLDQYAEPYHARIEHQDWGTPWTEYRPHFDPDPATITGELNAYQETLLAYARQFWFGE